MESEIVATSEEDIIESNAERWARRAVDVLLKASKKVDEVSSLEALAILDAEFSITDHYDTDEVDLFLDDFSVAVTKQEGKQDVIKDRIAAAKAGNDDEKE